MLPFSSCDTLPSCNDTDIEISVCKCFGIASTPCQNAMVPTLSLSGIPVFNSFIGGIEILEYDTRSGGGILSVWKDLWLEF